MWLFGVPFIERTWIFHLALKIEQFAKLLRQSIRDNEVLSAAKVDPNQAEILPNRMLQMQKSLKAIELDLRKATA